LPDGTLQDAQHPVVTGETGAGQAGDVLANVLEREGVINVGKNPGVNIGFYSSRTRK
jgi:hypothetical protein